MAPNINIPLWSQYKINPIQDGEGDQKRLLYQFLGLSQQNLLNFSFNPFTTLLYNFKTIPSDSPKLLSLNQGHPSKKQFFWSKPYKIEVMITSLIEILVLPNFSHMTTFTI